jgi:hypothetical protein
MIVFSGTKKIGVQSFLIFSNDNGSFANIPVTDEMCSFFLLHFDRLLPGTKSVVVEEVKKNK